MPSTLVDDALPLTGAGGPTLTGGAQYKTSGSGLPNRVTIGDDLYKQGFGDYYYGAPVFNQDSASIWVPRYSPASGNPRMDQFSLSTGALLNTFDMPDVVTPDRPIAVFPHYVTPGTPSSSDRLYVASYATSHIYEYNMAGSIRSTTDTSAVAPNPTRVARVRGSSKIWVIGGFNGAATEYTLGGTATGRTIAGTWSHIWADAANIYLTDETTTPGVYKVRDSDLAALTNWTFLGDLAPLPGHVYISYLNCCYVDGSAQPHVWDNIFGTVDRLVAGGGSGAAAVDKRIVWSGSPLLRGSSGVSAAAGNANPQAAFQVSPDGNWYMFGTEDPADAPGGPGGFSIRAVRANTQRARWTWNNPSSSSATVQRISVPGSTCNELGSTYDMRKTRFYWSTNGGSTRTEFTPGSTLAITVGVGGALTFDADFTDTAGPPSNAPFIGGDAGEGPHVISSQVATGGGGSAPTVSNFVPSPGAPLTPTQALQFDIVDVDGSTDLKSIVLFVDSGAGTTKQVVYDGTSFVPGWQNSKNTIAAITNGYRFTICPDIGWSRSSNVRLDYRVVDGAGHLAA